MAAFLPSSNQSIVEMARKKKQENEEVQEETQATTEEQGNVGEENNEANNQPGDELSELKDKYLRLYSDFDNFRKRTIKEKADIISSASGSVIKELLPILDDFERAIDNNEKVEDMESLKEGFKLIFHKLSNTLKQKGLESMDAKGEVFDAEKHEAITNIPVENEADKGKVIDVVERGYNLNGKPLRYAKVVVGQ